LFAEDAVVNAPAGTFVGRGQIRGLYRDAINANVSAVARDFQQDGDQVRFISAATGPSSYGASSLAFKRGVRVRCCAAEIQRSLTGNRQAWSSSERELMPH
jgi:hypothetical protein